MKRVVNRAEDGGKAVLRKREEMSRYPPLLAFAEATARGHGGRPVDLAVWYEVGMGTQVLILKNPIKKYWRTHP